MFISRQLRNFARNPKKINQKQTEVVQANDKTRMLSSLKRASMREWTGSCYRVYYSISTRTTANLCIMNTSVRGNRMPLSDDITQ